MSPCPSCSSLTNFACSLTLIFSSCFLRPFKYSLTPELYSLYVLLCLYCSIFCGLLAFILLLFLISSMASPRWLRCLVLGFAAV